MNASEMFVIPMGIYVLYVICFFIYSFFCRVNAIKAGELSPFYYKDYQNKPEVPQKLIILERHMDHQFQVPTVFLVTGAVLLSMQVVSMVSVYLAWGFVISRFIHTYIHLGQNKILWRAGVYAIGGIMILSMWGQLFYQVLSR